MSIAEEAKLVKNVKKTQKSMYLIDFQSNK